MGGLRFPFKCCSNGLNGHLDEQWSLDTGQLKPRNERQLMGNLPMHGCALVGVKIKTLWIEADNVSHILIRFPLL